MLRRQRVLILAADRFEDIELLYPIHRLREEGIDVVVAGLSTAPLTGKKGHGPLTVDMSVAEVDAHEFAAVIIPGGYAPVELSRSERVLTLVRHFDNSVKPIAIMCHGGLVAIAAGIVGGRRVTSYPDVRDDMVAAGANWVDESCVVDGNLISARRPADLGAWMKALIAALDASDGPAETH